MENRISHYRSYLVASGNGPGENTFPKAFVNILLFDKEFNFLDIAYEQIDGGEQPVGSSTKTDHDHLTREYTVREEGYAYVYISNENPTYMQVYFDDVTITHTPSRIIQYNEYYPYGLRTGASWTRENNSNNFLYNAGSELNETIGWYETMLRDYDPVLGRFMQVDPLATRYASLSGYHYAFGNPVMFNDPSGAYGEQSGSIPSWLSDIIGELMQSRYGGRWDGNGYSYYTSAQQAYQSGVAYNDYHNSWGYTYYGSRRASAQAYRNMKRTGSRHLPSRSHFAHGEFRWKKDNGSNISFSFQDAQQGDPIIFVSFGATPNGFDKVDYLNQLHAALVANGFNSALELKRNSLAGKFSAWWNKSPTGVISFNYPYNDMPPDAGGFSRPNQPNSIIIYPGLSGIYGQAKLETWSYVNATMHEIGHAFFGFDHSAPEGYGIGISGIAPSIMDYRYVYTNGQGFNTEEQKVIKSSIWGK